MPLRLQTRSIAFACTPLFCSFDDAKSAANRPWPMLWPRTPDDVVLLCSCLWLLAVICLIAAAQCSSRPLASGLQRARLKAHSSVQQPVSSSRTPTSNRDVCAGDGAVKAVKRAAVAKPEESSLAAADTCAFEADLISAHTPGQTTELTPAVIHCASSQGTCQPFAALQTEARKHSEACARGELCLTTAAMPLSTTATDDPVQGAASCELVERVCVTTLPYPEGLPGWPPVATLLGAVRSIGRPGRADSVPAEAPSGALAVTPLLNDWLAAAFEQASKSGPAADAWFQNGLSVAWLLELLTMCTKDLEKVRAGGATAMEDAKKRGEVEALVASLKDVTRLLQQQAEAAAAVEAAPSKPRKGKAARNRGASAGSKVVAPQEDPVAACRRVRECLDRVAACSGAVAAKQLCASPPLALSSACDPSSPISPLSASSPPVFTAERISVPQAAQQRAARQRKLITRRLMRPRSATPIVTSCWDGGSKPVFASTPDGGTLCEACRDGGEHPGPAFVSTTEEAPAPAVDTPTACKTHCAANNDSAAADTSIAPTAEVPTIRRRPAYDDYPVDALECNAEELEHQPAQRRTAVAAGRCLLESVLKMSALALPLRRAAAAGQPCNKCAAVGVAVCASAELIARICFNLLSIFRSLLALQNTGGALLHMHRLDRHHFLTRRSGSIKAA